GSNTRARTTSHALVPADFTRSHTVDTPRWNTSNRDCNTCTADRKIGTRVLRNHVTTRLMRARIAFHTGSITFDLNARNMRPRTSTALRNRVTIVFWNHVDTAPIARRNANTNGPMKLRYRKSKNLPSALIDLLKFGTIVP